MGPEVEVIKKSSCPGCPDITTLRLRYWRAAHAELLTHRALSRNASSSRAIPVARLAAASEDMHVPVFRQNLPGMQAGGYLTPEAQFEAEEIWRRTAAECLDSAKRLADLGVHKQWANRMLEWFGRINVVVTATDWDNFFDLRLAKNVDGWPVALDEFHDLAAAIREAIEAAPVRVLKPGEWHLPFVSEGDGELDLETMKKVSAARCASVSYQTVDGKHMSPVKATALCDKLIASGHWSPFEHQAMADESVWGHWNEANKHANFTGWAQWRHFLEREREEGTE